MTQSTIEWTEHTWNPIVGCSIKSPGCINCYAMKEAYRFGFNPKLERYHGLTKLVNGNAVWTGELRRAPRAALHAPLLRRKPTLYFVNSMGDLFHEECPDEWIDEVFAIMALTPQHTYQVLTKRADRMQAYACGWMRRLATREVVIDHPTGQRNFASLVDWISLPNVLPNVWLGVSTERQQEADERIPHLLQAPAAVRFISAEPLLGPVDLTRLCVGESEAEFYEMPEIKRARFVIDGLRGVGSFEWPGLDWVIAGGESGKDARDNDFLTNARSLLAQCRDADVPFFGKQNVRKVLLPPDLLVREWPTAATAYRKGTHRD